MSNFPQDRHELLRADYKFVNSSKCRGCEAQIEWWLTTRGKKMPFNPMPNEFSPAVSHHSTCPNAASFRPANTAPDPRTVAPHEKESPLARAIRLIREKHNARVVVVVDELGTTASWQTGIPGEELRQDLISAANFVRTTVTKEASQA